MRSVLLFAYTLLLCISASAQTNFYAVDTIQNVELFFSNPLWDYELDTAKLGAESYLMADSARINGIGFDSVGVRYKGNSSYDSTSAKNPFHIELNHFKPQQYYGVEDIRLSNCYKDPSMIREVLGYQTAAKMMAVSRANFARVFVNGGYVGLYSNVEGISNAWAKRNLGSDGDMIIKCNPIVNPGVTVKSNFRKISPYDSTTYAPFYEVKSNSSFSNVVALIDSINSTTSLRGSMNVDRLLWMCAFNDLFVNLDSYTGVFAQNHFALRDNSGKYNCALWDLNMCYGGFPYLGSANSSLNTQSISGLKRLSLMPHSGDSYWPLLNRIYADSTELKEYLGHLLAMLSNEIKSNAYISDAQSLQAIIADDVALDSNKFFSTTDFQNGLLADISVGNYFVPGIQNLMSARALYIDSLANAMGYIVPLVSIPAFSNSPSFNNSLTVAVTCAQEIKAYFCYRFDPWSAFVRAPMYDDGMHGDGAAGDHVYGVAFVPKGTVVQYYAIAEGSKVSAFNPEYAEHVFYEMVVDVPPAQPGFVVLSEAMANNTITALDGNGEYEDWLEVQSTAGEIALGNLFLSDDIANLAKWQFPSNATTLSGVPGLPIVWCDNAIYQKGMHANFKLNDTGTSIFLSDATGKILDSLSWDFLLLPNQSYMRCNSAVGTNTSLALPTSFGMPNCGVAVKPYLSNRFLSLVPNPAVDVIKIVFDSDISVVKAVDVYGRESRLRCSSAESTVDISHLRSGIYIIVVNDRFISRLVKE
jgi:hypothetical protein